MGRGLGWTGEWLALAVIRVALGTDKEAVRRPFHLGVREGILVGAVVDDGFAAVFLGGGPACTDTRAPPTGIRARKRTADGGRTPCLVVSEKRV